MTKIDLTKPHLCHICQEEGKFFYKKWWCGHDKHLKGVCSNDKREKVLEKIRGVEGHNLNTRVRIYGTL